MENENLEKAALEYAKQFDYAEDSSPQVDFIEGAKSDAARDYWFEKFKNDQAN
jgi:hypothetical protein